MICSQTDRLVSEISCLQNGSETLGDLVIIKETLEEMSEANNFHDSEVNGKLSNIDAKLEKNSVSEYHGHVMKEVTAIKALVTQTSKVCTRNYFLFYYSMFFIFVFLLLKLLSILLSHERFFPKYYDFSLVDLVLQVLEALMVKILALPQMSLRRVLLPAMCAKLPLILRRTALVTGNSVPGVSGGTTKCTIVP